MAIHALLVVLLLVACGGESNNTTIQVIGTGGAAGSVSAAGSSGAGVGGTDSGEAGAAGAADAGGAGGEAPAPYEGPPVMTMGDPGQLIVRGVEGRLAELAIGVVAPWYGEDYELRVLSVLVNGERFGLPYGPGFESEVDDLTETLEITWYPGNEPEGEVDRSDTIEFQAVRLHDSGYSDAEDITAAWVELDGERVAEWP
jgi:hypothetical protein